MNTKNRGIYISFFWKYANKEQIEDMLELSIDGIIDYILYLGEEFYNQYGTEKSVFSKLNLIELEK